MAKTKRPKPDFRGADLMNTSCPPLARSILDVIGRTPLLELTRSVESRGLSGRLLVKLEYFSPGGSKKDRIALEIIREARASGELRPGQTVVELTSGNTGTGLAVVCRAMGHPFVALISRNGRGGYLRRFLNGCSSCRGLETACRAGGRGHNRISRLRQRAQVLEHGSFPLSPRAASGEKAGVAFERPPVNEMEVVSVPLFRSRGRPVIMKSHTEYLTCNIPARMDFLNITPKIHD